MPVRSSPLLLAISADLSISAVAKIIRHLNGKVNAEELLPRWIESLPIFVDAEEFALNNTMFLELLSSNHALVQPTSASAPHIVKILVSSLQFEQLPVELEGPLAQALKAYVAAVPGGVGPLPQDVQEKLAASA